MASGGAEAKKDIYDEPPTLGIPRQYVVAMMAQLFILGFRGAVPYNWRTVPSVSIFSYCETLFLAGDFVSRQQRSFSRALFGTCIFAICRSFCCALLVHWSWFLVFDLFGHCLGKSLATVY